jgi:hypothetical protein
MSSVAVDGGATRADDKWMWLWDGTAPLLRDHDHHVGVQAKFTDDGYLKAWRDGRQIVDYRGGLG